MRTLAKLILTAAGSSLIFTGCTAIPPAAWEFRTLTTDQPNEQAVLENLGKAGWEMVSCTTKAKDPSGTKFEYQYVFKRPKQP